MAPFSFLEFAAERVRKKYPGKDPDALKPIFIAAVKSWEDLREAYPEWRENQDRAARKAEQDRAIQKARDRPPQKCRCGGALNSSLACKNCGGYYSFDEGELKYIFSGKPDISLVKNFRKTLEERQCGGEAMDIQGV